MKRDCLEFGKGANRGGGLRLSLGTICAAFVEVRECCGRVLVVAMARGMFVEHVMPHSAGVAANRTRLCPIWRILTRCDFMEIDCNRMTTHTQHVITCIRSPMMRE